MPKVQGHNRHLNKTRPLRCGEVFPLEAQGLADRSKAEAPLQEAKEQKKGHGLPGPECRQPRSWSTLCLEEQRSLRCAGSSRAGLAGARHRFWQDSSRGGSSRPVMPTLDTALLLGYSSQPAHTGVHPSITAGNISAAF